MLNMIGECTVEGIKCKFMVINDEVHIIPLISQDLSSLYRRMSVLDDGVIEVPIIGNEDAFDYLYYSEVILLLGGIKAKLSATVEYYSNADISEVEIQSESLSYYFSPAEIYYDERQENKYKNDDLLYDARVVNKFYFNYHGCEVGVIMQFGNMLDNGICSRLNLRGSLRIQFESTRDHGYLFGLIRDIFRCLEFALYSSNIDVDSINLVHYEQGKRSIKGQVKLYDKPLGTSRYYGRNSNYKYLKTYMCEFFNVIANDRDMTSMHICNNSSQSDNRYVRMFAAFENEFNRLPDDVRLKNTRDIDYIRNEIIDRVKEVQVDNDQEIQFKNLVLDGIKKVGRAYGLRKKILVACDYVEESMISTNKLFGINNKKVKDISSEVPTIRSKIVHSNYSGDLGDILHITYIEWITYAMLLIRCNVPKSDIEYILGRLFLCNTKEISEKLP